MKNKNIIYAKLPLINKGKINSKEKENKDSSRLLTVTLIVFIIIFLLFSGYSMAKIIGESIIKVNSQIAEPVLEIESNPSIDITEENNSGTYTFKVKNYNENNKITEANMKYYIEILPNLDDTVSIQLFESGNEIKLQDNKTDYIEISNSAKIDREYQIKVAYTKNDSQSMEDILDRIQVKVHAEEVEM